MSKLDDFKKFVKGKPYLVDKVHRKEISWQELYEAYDIYGENHNIFKEIQADNKNNTLLTKEGITSALNVIKNVDLEKVSSGLENVKKVVGAIQEITKPAAVDNSIPEYIKKSTFKRYND